MAVRTRRSTALLGAALALTAFVATACPPAPPTDPGTTTTTIPGSTTTTTTPSTVKTLTNASFEWTVNAQANLVSQSGQPNWWSAGVTDGTATTYVATNNNVTVLKKNASGTYVPIASEPAVAWGVRNRDGNNNVVGMTSGSLGQKVRYTGGTGTVNTATGASTIQWTGTFSINFYGTATPFWIKNPKLAINASGVGTLKATVAGIKSDQLDPTIRIPLPEREVTLANFSGVPGANSTGFTATPTFLNSTVTLPVGQVQVGKNSGNQAYWGAWPQTFVDYHVEAGTGAYWYTSGGVADPHKPSAPVSVAYNIV